jgi:hypothetical protein
VKREQDSRCEVFRNVGGLWAKEKLLPERGAALLTVLKNRERKVERL